MSATLAVIFLLLNTGLASWNIADGDYYLLPLNALGAVFSFLWMREDF